MGGGGPKRGPMGGGGPKPRGPIGGGPKKAETISSQSQETIVSTEGKRELRCALETSECRVAIGHADPSEADLNSR